MKTRFQIEILLQCSRFNHHSFLHYYVVATQLDSTALEFVSTTEILVRSEAMYTVLHRSLGASPGRITSDLIDKAIDHGVGEARGLDYKAKPDDPKNIKKGDVAKDVAAMANTGGGVIIYGVAENGEGYPTKRISVTDVVGNEDTYARSYLQATTDRIFPPVFGIEPYFVGNDDGRALVVEVPESRDIPHLVESVEEKGRRYFAVPVRVGASTRFQTEPEIARMYRDRFSAASDSQRHIEELFADTVNQGDDNGVWCVGVGIPRYKSLRPAPTENEVSTIAYKAREGRRKYGYDGASSPLSAALKAARRGLRKWQFSSNRPNTSELGYYLGLPTMGRCRLSGMYAMSELSLMKFLPFGQSGPLSIPFWPLNNRRFIQA